MNITDIASATARMKKLVAILRESYNYNIDFDKLTRTRAMNMHRRAATRLTESTDMNTRIKLRMIAETVVLWHDIETISLMNSISEGLDDDTMEEAKVILAARELSDKIQRMIEDAAKMQVQDLLPIIDAMRSEIGSAESEAFAAAADEALQSLVTSTKAAKSQLDNAISGAQGQSTGTDMQNFDDAEAGMNMPDDDMSAQDDKEMGSADDDDDDIFGAEPATMGGDQPLGREMKDGA